MTTGRNIASLTIAEVALAIAAGKLMPRELVESCLERIDALEPRIQAWALVDREGALRAAESLGEELRQGRNRGPLHGIPVGLKDIFYTAGLRTQAGSPFWADFVPEYDATAVARLKEAGAIVLGKTHTTQFASGDPAPTRNPWNVEHTPGGSSSGSGAAVAAGMCLAALGTQTGGSVLRPAAYNGVVGLKPESGRVSKYGVVPLSWTLDHVGIIARTVTDAALVFRAIAGHDPADYHSLAEAIPNCLSAQLMPPRLGLVRAYFFERADEEMRRHADEVVERLRRAGASINEIAFPASSETIDETHDAIVGVEAAAYHQEMFAQHREEYQPRVRRLIEKGLTVSAIQYANALETRLRMRAEMERMLLNVDALITPGAPGPAPRSLETTGSAVMHRPWSMVGLPAIGLPTGLSEDGLPLAIQLVGPSRREDQLLSIALWCEKVLGARLILDPRRREG
ncbi:MAG: amidase [Chloroflexi bacterium]|nr:amidase [Chloroflexota bacterium]